jgi:hypothetical protein
MTTPVLTTAAKAWAGFVISLLMSILTAVSQMLTEGTTKNVLLVVGVALTSIGTGLGVYQVTNQPK